MVFCGGSDIFPLTAGFSGVLVRNVDEQLVANVRAEKEHDPALCVCFVRGGLRGLNGNYSSGVIESAFLYGLFGESA